MSLRVFVIADKRFVDRKYDSTKLNARYIECVGCARKKQSQHLTIYYQIYVSTY